jgi:hypothetical protein
VYELFRLLIILIDLALSGAKQILDVCIGCAMLMINFKVDGLKKK